ncbi:MAG: histidine phosphatase family protein [Actinomycetota bacterium]
MLILVRHGRTEGNAKGLLQGRLDHPLDEVGERQAAAVAAAIGSQVDIDTVIASPLQRAQQTAAAFGRSVETDDRWAELSYGRYEGVPHADVPSEVWERWRADHSFIPAGGESLIALDERVRAAAADAAERAATSNVLVVSHVSPIKAAVAWALDTGIGLMWNSHLDQASICRIGFRGPRPILYTFNETVEL